MRYQFLSNLMQVIHLTIDFNDFNASNLFNYRI
jgi:hypothetical protein